MTYNDYKEVIKKVAYKNSDFNKLENLVEKMAYDEELTNVEYSQLYKMVMDIIRF